MENKTLSVLRYRLIPGISDYKTHSKKLILVSDKGWVFFYPHSVHHPTCALLDSACSQFPNVHLHFLLLSFTASRLLQCITSIMWCTYQLIIPSSPLYIFPSLSLLLKTTTITISLLISLSSSPGEETKQNNISQILPVSQLWLSALWKITQEVFWKRYRRDCFWKFIPLFGSMGNQSPNLASSSAKCTSNSSLRFHFQ